MLTDLCAMSNVNPAIGEPIAQGMARSEDKPRNARPTPKNPPSAQLLGAPSASLLWRHPCVGCGSPKHIGWTRSAGPEVERPHQNPPAPFLALRSQAIRQTPGDQTQPFDEYRRLWNDPAPSARTPRARRADLWPRPGSPRGSSSAAVRHGGCSGARKQRLRHPLRQKIQSPRPSLGQPDPKAVRGLEPGRPGSFHGSDDAHRTRSNASVMPARNRSSAVGTPSYTGTRGMEPEKALRVALAVRGFTTRPDFGG